MMRRLVVLVSLFSWPCAALDAVVHQVPAVVNAAREAPAAEIGRSCVVRDYRETGTNRNDRFVYLFATDREEDLLKLTVTYPDDKPRLAEIYLLDNAHWGLNALGTGYFTGLPHPLTHSNVTQSAWFHVHQATNFGIAVMSSGQGTPAAVTSLMIERAAPTEGVPAWPAEAEQPHRRRLGAYWEDHPLVTGYGGGIARGGGGDERQFAAVLDRHIAGLRRVGHNAVIYPVVWYTGALYQPSREHLHSTNSPIVEPPAFDKMMARRFSEAGIDFWPSIRNWSLPSQAAFVRSPDDISSGRVTGYVNTVTASGKVITKSQWHAPPLLNALHPRVQAALTNLVTEIMDRLGAERCVKGIALFHTIHSSHGLGTIDQSYDDYTVGLYAAERGLTLPPRTGAPADRFSQWHDWLKKEHWPEWIQWRKQKETELIERLAGIIAAKKPGAKLQLMVMYPVPTMNVGRTVNDVAAYLDDTGLDIAALAKNPDIVITRIQRAGGYQFDLRAMAAGSPQAEATRLRAELEFDAGWQKPFVGHTFGSIIHYTYFEVDFGGQPRLELPPEHRVREFAWHVTSPKGAGRNALEGLARAVATFDARFLAHGGFHIGPQFMEETVQPFAAVFESLPDVPFTEVVKTNGVVVRSARAEGKRWTYAINSTAELRAVTVEFAAAGTLERLGLTPGNVSVAPDRPLVVRLAPYELAAWLSPKIASCTISAVPITRLGGDDRE